MAVTAQLRSVSLITPVSTSNTVSGPGISRALAVTEDRACEKHMLSFHAKKSDRSIGPGGLDEFGW